MYEMVDMNYQASLLHSVQVFQPLSYTPL